MARSKHKKAKRKVASVKDYLRPTDERVAHNDTRSLGMATQIVPVIETLRADNLLTDEEYRALAYYRDQACLADRSLVKSNIDFSVRGGEGGPGVAILSANIETGRMERNMGPLMPLCRAVCVDDVTLEQWCVSHGSRFTVEKANGTNPKSALESMMLITLGVPEPDPFDVGVALLELRYAAGGIVVNRR